MKRSEVQVLLGPRLVLQLSKKEVVMLRFLRRITLLGAIIGAGVWIYQNLLGKQADDEDWTEAQDAPDLR